VYAWESGPALVQTVDFFTPIVDDPYLYGRIAAANSLSDVYAMGGRPLTALAIAGLPAKGLDTETIAAVFRGGYDVLREAGVALLGGHTVQDAEIKFGYAVTGAVDPARIWTNAGARPGDALVLTKPLGTGVIGTAIKYERAPQHVVDAAVRSMTHLNRDAAETARGVAGLHACTDITGFGLVGHACEMAAGSGARIVIDAARVPLLPGARELLRKNRSGGMATNQEHFESRVSVERGVDPDVVELLYDPQTSGGLLFALDPADAPALLAHLAAAGVDSFQIGEVVPLVSRGPILVIR
jgi:selenide, water dikinase